MSRNAARGETLERKRLLLNSTSAGLLFFVNVAVAFFLSPVIVRGLGNRDYGIWDLLLSFCGYLGLLEVGVGAALVRFVARSAALGDHLEVRRTFVTSAAALLSAGLVSLIVMSAVSLDPYGIFNVPSGQSPVLATLCLLAGCNLFVQFAGIAPVAYLMGLQRHYRINSLRVVLAVVSGVATYLALTRGGGNGLLWLSCLLLAGNVTQYSIFLAWASKSLGPGGLSPRLFSLRTLKDLVVFGVNSSLLMLSDRIQRTSVPFVISHTIGVASIVFYSIPARLAEYGMSLMMAIGFPLTPAFSAAEARGGIPETRQAWLETTRLMQMLMMGMAVGLGVLGRDFIAVWIGPQYAERGKWILIFIAWSMFLAGLAPNSSRLLVALGRHGQVAWKLVVISVLAVLTAILAARRFGLPGIAAAVSLANVAGFALCWHKACELLGMTVLQHLRTTIASTGPAVTVLAVVLAGLRAVAPPVNYGILAAEAGLASAIYLAAAWYFAFGRAEREKMAAWVAGMAARFGGRPGTQQVS